MEEAWEALARYKFLAEQLKELKRELWMDLFWCEEAELSLSEAEEELDKLKLYINMNYEVRRVD